MLLIKIISILASFCLSISILSTEEFPQKLNILMCKAKCESLFGCTYVRYERKQLRCDLLFGENTSTTRKNGTVLLKVPPKNYNLRCGQKEMLLKARSGSLKCVKGPKNKGELCKVPDKAKAKDERSSSILYRLENMTLQVNKKLLQLPFTLKPGMKMTVYGKSVQGFRYSELSITMDPEHPYNLLKWLHICPYWIMKEVRFTKGLRPWFVYNGTFPISDETHFAIALEFTPSLTKVYADKTLVKSMKLITGITEMYAFKYSKIHLLVVQKTSNGCENVDHG